MILPPVSIGAPASPRSKAVFATSDSSWRFVAGTRGPRERTIGSTSTSATDSEVSAGGLGPVANVNRLADATGASVAHAMTTHVASRRRPLTRPP